MINIIKFLASLILFIALMAVIFYFLPSDLKVSGLEKLTGLIPETVKAKAEELLLTPSEKRAKLISQLENSLENLKNSKTAENVEAFIENSKNTLAELKEKSEETSIKEIITAKIADKLLNLDTSTNTNTGTDTQEPSQVNCVN